MKTLSDDEQFQVAESLEQLRLELENVDGYPIPPPKVMQRDGSFRPGEERVLEMRRALETVARLEKLLGAEVVCQGDASTRAQPSA